MRLDLVGVDDWRLEGVLTDDPVDLTVERVGGSRRLRATTGALTLRASCAWIGVGSVEGVASGAGEDDPRHGTPGRGRHG